MKEPVKKYTNKCHTEYMTLLSKNAKTKTNDSWDVDVEFDLAQVQHANRYLVSYIFDLPMEEIDEMEQTDFEKYLKKANTVKNPLSSTTSSKSSDQVWGQEQG